MAKLGRNDQCRCGSGKKYKKCCLPKDEAAAAERAAAAQRGASLNHHDWHDDGLDDASNRVVDLVHQGKLDEAEQAARDLLVRYPDVHDGFERLGMVFEKRGDLPQALIHYREALAFMRDHPDNYDEQATQWMVAKVTSLEQAR
jgi:tetratricopeptide (TPR) repeat protein